MPRTIAIASILSLTTLLLGCGDADTSAPLPGDGTLAPPPAGQGMQYRMVGHIEAGSEVEQCLFVEAPPEGLWVNRDEVRFDAGSHHVLLYETLYDEIPTAKDDGTPVDTRGAFDCSDGATNGWSVGRLIGGSQNYSGESAVRFPPDVALHVRPGAVLMMNAHYLNTTSRALEPEVRINLWTIPESQVAAEGDILFWYNIFIKAPAASMASARMRCRVPEDITLTNAQSHMHARGIGYTAEIVGQDMPFYSTNRWENVPVVSYDGFVIPGGSTVDYACAYNNPEDRDVYQGPRSSDEMCMLIASYYPLVPGLSYCSSDPDRPNETNSLGADWVGQGSASCAETVACVQAASEQDFFTDLQGCVTSSAAEVSPYVSDAVRCLLLALGDGVDPQQTCAKEFVTCLGH